jgi:hypothetical protein
MKTKYFHQGKPNLTPIVKAIVLFAQSPQIDLDAIALVGGWAKAARKSGFDGFDQPVHPSDLQRIIEQSPKSGGDVDFVVFVKNHQSHCQVILSEAFGSKGDAKPQDGCIDLVCSLPAKVRSPGIQLLLPAWS